MDFFDRIKELAKAQGTTIEQVMKKALGTSNSRDTYNGWRRRKLIPRGNVCLQLAQALGVSVDYLLTGNDANIDFTGLEKYLKHSELVDLADELSPANYKVLLGSARLLAEKE